MSKRIYIGLSKPRKETVVSKLIKIVLRTPYSHCYVRWKTSWGFDAVYEASGTSVKFVGGDIWHKRNKIEKEWPIDISIRTYHDKFLPYLMSRSGLQYAFMQLISLFFVLVFTRGPVVRV